MVSSMNGNELQLFGHRVRAERERLGMSQEGLADRSGLHRTYIGGVERGERNLGLLNVVRLAHALELPPEALFIDFRELREAKDSRGVGDG
jgi:transcriptional regulator with XRE-family HTH domain